MRALICRSLMYESLLSIRDEVGSATGFRVKLAEAGLKPGDQVVILRADEYDVMREAAMETMKAREAAKQACPDCGAKPGEECVHA